MALSSPVLYIFKLYGDPLEHVPSLWVTELGQSPVAPLDEVQAVPRADLQDLVVPRLPDHGSDRLAGEEGLVRAQSWSQGSRVRERGIFIVYFYKMRPRRQQSVSWFKWKS